MQSNPLSPSTVRPLVAIVDPMSGGYFLAERYQQLGLDVICVNSIGGMEEEDRKLFERCNKATSAIMPGAESGVRMAEKWAAEFGLLGNDPRTSDRRRNKVQMGEALKAKKIPICEQCFHFSVDTALEWADRIGYPVVVKPDESSGSDMVRICRSPEELREGATAILQTKTKYNFRSNGVLLQEFMAGDEYTVDGVVSNGVLIPFALGRYTKLQWSGGFVYDRIDFFNPASPHIDPQIIEYASQVVKALDVNVGPVHIEIMLTSRGPLLVELAARPHGGIATGVIDITFKPRFTDGILNSYLGRDPLGGDSLVQERYSAIYFLKNAREGHVISLPGRKRIPRLDSFVSDKWLISPGDHVKMTIDLATCPALIHLAHEDSAKLEQDIALIREAEAQGELIICGEMEYE